MIRTLTPKDAAEFRALRLRALKDHPKVFGASYHPSRRIPLGEWRKRLCATALRRVLGAFVNGRLVGTAGYFRETYPKERHRVTIWGVYVAPEARRGGIARALMTATIDRIARLRGVDTIVLCVSESAPGARALYVSLGFRPYGLDKRALKVGGRFVAEEPMVLAIR